MLAITLWGVFPIPDFGLIAVFACYDCSEANGITDCNGFTHSTAYLEELSVFLDPTDNQFSSKKHSSPHIDRACLSLPNNPQSVPTETVLLVSLITDRFEKLPIADFNQKSISVPHLYPLGYKSLNKPIYCTR
jgi:hypothetical protein